MNQPPSSTTIDGSTVDAVLFDLDGTLIDSTIATERAWTTWGRLMDLEGYRHTRHGLTARSLVEELIEPARQAEATELITRLEIEDTDGIHLKDGVAELLASLPAGSWTIVTSCTDELAAARMGAAGLERPAGMVTASMVTRGKPAPDGFLAGAQGLGVDITRCLVVEDTPAGLTAGRDAGARTLAVAGTYPADALGADAVLDSLARLTATPLADGTLGLSIAK